MVKANYNLLRYALVSKQVLENGILRTLRFNTRNSANLKQIQSRVCETNTLEFALCVRLREMLFLKNDN